MFVRTCGERRRRDRASRLRPVGLRPYRRGMTLDSVPALLIALLFVLPGVVYQTARTRLQGPHAEEQDNASRLMRALTASTVLIGVYVVAAGPALLSLTESNGDDAYAGLRANARTVALLGLTLLIAVPVTVALIEVWIVRRKEEGQARYDPTPTAWQWAAKRAFSQPGFVRVLTESGRWVGGYYGSKSHASGFPRPPELFVQHGYYMGDDGEFLAPKQASRGFWVRCDNATVVEFMEDTSVTETS